jgi:AcrR family transcriptional regulator
MGRATASGEPASNKRETILAAAVRGFAAHGLAGTGMREIARAAGLTEGTLYHYFDSKEALIREAFRWSAFQPADLRRALQRTELPLRERLLAAGAEFLAALRRDPHWTRVVIREALRAAPETDTNPIRDPLVSLAAERTRALAAALREEQAAGQITRCEPRRVAELFFHALIGHFVAQAISGASPAPRGDVDPFLAQLVELVAERLERPVPRRGGAGRRRRSGRAS